MIHRIIARHGRPHQAGPFVLTFAHARSHTAIRSIFQFVTPEDLDHEVVIKISGHNGIAPSDLGSAATDSRTGRLITSIGSAGTRRFEAKGFGG
jgi:hypothetical protein